MNFAVRLRTLTLPALALSILAGCDLVSRYMAESPDDELAQAALAHWAAPGRPFLEGASGRDTVASVNATGARAWEVAVVPPSGGAPSVWTFEVTKVEIYPVFRGNAFANWLDRRSRELGMHTFLPPEVRAPLRDGRIEAVGELEIRYGLSDRTGRNTETRVAYRRPGADGGEASWEIQPESRSPAVLLQMLQTVADDMVRHDERVQTCMGSVSPQGVPRADQLKCLAQVLEQQFGPGA